MTIKQHFINLIISGEKTFEVRKLTDLPLILQEMGYFGSASGSLFNGRLFTRVYNEKGKYQGHLIFKGYDIVSKYDELVFFQEEWAYYYRDWLFKYLELESEFLVLKIEKFVPCHKGKSNNVSRETLKIRKEIKHG